MYSRLSSSSPSRMRLSMEHAFDSARQLYFWPLLKIRLRRTGAKKQPSYRVVVADSTAPRDGTFLDILGHYNPLTNPTTFVVDADRTRQWLARGALPTDRVARLLSKSGLVAPPPPRGQAQPAAFE